MVTDALDEVMEYVALQKSLLSAFCPTAASGGPASFADLPKIGEVNVGSEPWRYTRHGAGVLFHHQQTGRQIDVHRHLDRPNLFDAWRLRTYFGSLGRRGVKMVERAIGSRGLPLDQAIEELLDIWLRAEAIIEENGSYRLSDEGS